MFLKGRIRLAGVLCVSLFMSADSAISALSTEVDDTDTVIVSVPTLPSVYPQQLVFVCDPVLSPAGTTVCGLVDAGQLTYIGAAQDVQLVLVEGSGLVTFVLYPVQACYRHYAMIMPNPVDEHFTDPELAADVGLLGALVHEGFPTGTCPYPFEKPLEMTTTVSIE